MSTILHLCETVHRMKARNYQLRDILWAEAVLSDEAKALRERVLRIAFAQLGH